jgi:hypothetical protein
MTAAMANIQCPFRGTLEFVVAEEEEEEGGSTSGVPVVNPPSTK